jgi:hypothetical protein
MPEDQGVNGDIWNNEASILLTKLGWVQVGDSNIDVVNEDGEKHGLDGMFVFSDVKRNHATSLGVFVEAKRYQTTSFKISLLDSWITTIDKKLNKTKNSSEFQRTFPKIGKTIIQNGLIVIWFSDLEKYSNFKNELEKKIPFIRLPGKSSSKTPNFIYLLHNHDILRLCSLISIIERLNISNKKSPVQFYYPSSDFFNNPVARSKVLTVDYMFSKFILAETIIRNVENKIVFYFGELTIQAFQRLKSFLLSSSFIEKKKPLTIYKFLRNDEFRKIEPDVIRLFTKIEIKLKIEEMDIFSDLPTFLKLN